MGERVSNEPFRRAFLASGFSAYEVAREAGWMRRKTERRAGHGRYVGQVRETPDATKVKRSLGLTQRDGKYIDTISEEDAFKLLPIFPSLDPVDVDL